MSAVNVMNENDDEREIASQAAYALRESFITGWCFKKYADIK